MTALREEVQNISHLDVARYLKSRSWEKVDDFSENGLMDIYRNDKYLIEVMVDETLPSYRDRIRQTVVSLAHIEDKKCEDVIREIENVGLFSIRVKADTPFHKIRLDESIAMRTGLQKAFLASAHSILTPIIDIKRMSARDPNTLVSYLYDDQTEAASYIANFRTVKSVSGDLKSETVFGKFKEAIIAIKEASTDDTIPGKSQYDELAKKGINKQFLENIEMLDLKQSLAKSLTLEIIDNFSGSQVSVIFEENDFDFIRDFYKTLAQTFEKEEDIGGIIVGLISQNSAAGGEIRVSSIIDGSTKVVRVRLSKEDFNKAAAHFATTRSHSKKSSTKITGLLRRRRRSTEMVDVSKIEFVAT